MDDQQKNCLYSALIAGNLCFVSMIVLLSGWGAGWRYSISILLGLLVGGAAYGIVYVMQD